MKKNWYGITYPFGFLVGSQSNWFTKLWKRFMCPHGWHLFDECWGASNSDDYEMVHSLYCDACDLDIEIKAAYRWNYKTEKSDYLGD
jgi:hypothetical protein